MTFIVNIEAIVDALQMLGGEARAKSIQDYILLHYCGGIVPPNYRTERTFRQTVQRKIEDFCPQAEGFALKNRDSKFLRVGHGIYKLVTQSVHRDFPSIEESAPMSTLIEGATRLVTVNAYERNWIARRKCIEHYGYICQCCNFDFERAYGTLGENFIHVHHITPISQIKASYVIDPISDLIPVCANCHAIIHRFTPALSIGAVQAVLKLSSLRPK